MYVYGVCECVFMNVELGQPPMWVLAFYLVLSLFFHYVQQTLALLGCLCFYFPPSCRHPCLQTSMLLLLLGFAWFLGIRTEVFMLAWQMLCLLLSSLHWDDFP